MRYCQSNKYQLPLYNVISFYGGIFQITVNVNGGDIGSGSAKTKKQAEQNAARNSLDILLN